MAKSASILLRLKKRTSDTNGVDGHHITSISIDYPQENDVIQPGPYSIRISAPDALKVEVSIDRGEWQLCRESVSYYWFDWTPSEPGEHQIVARVHSVDEQIKKSRVRKCQVK